MVNLIKLKRSSTPDAVPGSLEDGELAINQADGILFWKNATAAIKKLFLGRARDEGLAIRETIVSPSSGIINIDLTLGNNWVVDLDSNVTSINIENPPPNGFNQRIVVSFVQDGIGGHTVIGWPASVNWLGDNVPAMDGTPDARDTVILETSDGGVSYQGVLAASDNIASRRLRELVDGDWSTDQMIYLSGVETTELTPLSAFARELIAADDAAATRAVLSLGTSATLNVGTVGGTVAAGNDSRFHSVVTLAGSPNYLTISGQTITRALVNLVNHITGVLGIANGGTGASTASGARSSLNAVNKSGDTMTGDLTVQGSITSAPTSGAVVIGGNVSQGNNVRYQATESGVGTMYLGLQAGSVSWRFSSNSDLSSPSLTVPGSGGKIGFGTRAEWGTFGGGGASAGVVEGVNSMRRDSSINTTNLTDHLRFHNPDGLVGSIDTTNLGTNFKSASDGNLKEAVVDADKAAVVRLMRDARPVEFEWKAHPGTKHLGFIAQEMASIYPDAVMAPTEPGEPWMMDLSKLVPAICIIMQRLVERAELNDRFVSVNQPVEEDQRIATIKADTMRQDMIDRLRTATPDQINNFVDGNVTDLASARTMFKRMLLILSTTVRE